MRMRVCLFLIVPIVIVSALQQESNTHLFTKFNRYSGYACHAQYRVFDIREARSRSDCAIACANVHECSAISHVESLKRCIGCNSTTFDMADVLENVTGRCPEGWKRYSKSCYYLNFKITMNFTAAKEHCSRMGAHVIVPDDADENTFIFHMKPPALATWGTWIGIEKEPMKTWLSYHNNKTVTYLPWYAGEPNGGTYELCATWGEHFTLQWDDVPCEWNRFVGCENELQH